MQILRASFKEATGRRIEHFARWITREGTARRRLTDALARRCDLDKAARRMWPMIGIGVSALTLRTATQIYVGYHAANAVSSGNTDRLMLAGMFLMAVYPVTKIGQWAAYGYAGVGFLYKKGLIAKPQINS